MQILGVFQTVFPDGEMNIIRALLISLVGFMIVFLILGILTVFVEAMGKVFDAIEAKKKAAAPAATSAAAPSAVTGTPLPDGTSAGDLKLIDVSDEEAAVIMAVVSNRSGIPLNRLKFNSIKKTEDK